MAETEVTGYIQKILSDPATNKAFYKAVVGVLRQQNYDTRIQDKEIDLIKQMYSPNGLIIQERVSDASGRAALAGAALPPGAKNGWRRPLSGGSVTSEFGYRIHPIFGTKRLHAGIDIGCAEGTPVFAAREGVIKTASTEGGYGKSVVINHGGGVISRYAHNSAFVTGIVPGAQVKQGEQISFSGSTGFSTGGHLHFEILFNGVQQNPRDFIKF